MIVMMPNFHFQNVYLTLNIVVVISKKQTFIEILTAVNRNTINYYLFHSKDK